jgi:hypothetical protein
MSLPKDNDDTHQSNGSTPPASTPVSNDEPSPNPSPIKPFRRSSKGQEVVAKVVAPHAVLPKQQRTSVKAPFKPKSNRRKPSFAEKLHAILSNKHLSPIISWLSTGKSFCILNKEQFTRHVLPFYFREAKFESFSRRIKRWGFRKMYTTGQKQVIYTHDLFQKDRLDLCRMMNGRANETGAKDELMDPHKFESVVAEQVRIADKMLREHEHCKNNEMASGGNDQPQVMLAKKPMKKRFVPSFTHQVPHVPAARNSQAMNYDHDPNMLDACLRMERMQRLQQIEQMYQMNMNFFGPSPQEVEMNRMKQGMSSSQGTSMNQGINFSQGMNMNQGVNLSRVMAMNQDMNFSQRMNDQVVRDPKVVRQLSTLDEDIKECEEQLLILQRLAVLKKKCRSLDH